MDDNARPHRSRAVTAYLQREAVTSVPWPALSPDPIEHIWDMLSRRILARESPVQSIRQLEAALHREWQKLSQPDVLFNHNITRPVFAVKHVYFKY
jgi:transposase